MKSTVSVVKGTDVDSSVRKAVELIGGIRKFIQPGQTVLIKPNFAVVAPPETGIVTDPATVDAVIGVCKEADPAKVIVGESGIVGFDTSEVFQGLGLENRFERLGAELVNLDQDEALKVDVPNGTVLKTARIFKTVYESDVVISVPSMKTHILTAATLGLKNMKGTIPDSMKKRMHRIGAKQKVRDFELDHAIADLNTVMPPTLTIIDGIIANEGYKPGTPGIGGTPVQFNTIVAGQDPVAVDAVGAYLMGFDSGEVRHIAYAAERGVGVCDMNLIDVKGEDLDQVRRVFVRPSMDGVVFDFKNISFLVGEGCSGCRESCYIALSGMDETQLKKMGKSVVVVGTDVDLAEIDEDSRLFLVGNCTVSNDLKGEHIEGCPPPGIHVRKCLLGQY